MGSTERGVNWPLYGQHWFKSYTVRTIYGKCTVSDGSPYLDQEGNTYNIILILILEDQFQYISLRASDVAFP